MKKIIIDIQEITNSCLYSDHYPNKETLKSLKNVEAKKNVTTISLEELSKKFGAKIDNSCKN